MCVSVRTSECKCVFIPPQQFPGVISYKLLIQSYCRQHHIFLTSRITKKSHGKKKHGVGLHLVFVFQFVLLKCVLLPSYTSAPTTPPNWWCAYRLLLCLQECGWPAGLSLQCFIVATSFGKHMLYARSTLVCVRRHTRTTLPGLLQIRDADVNQQAVFVWGPSPALVCWLQFAQPQCLFIKKHIFMLFCPDEE